MVDIGACSVRATMLIVIFGLVGVTVVSYILDRVIDPPLMG